MVGTQTHFEGLVDSVVGRNTETSGLTTDQSGWNNLIKNHKPEQDKIRGLMVGQDGLKS
jgi:hypothetical protein